MKIVKAISGGQTGVDTIGLLVARDFGIETGGTAPKGYRREVADPELLKDLGLVEHVSPDYPKRTKINVKNADVTVILASGRSPGSHLTKQLCNELDKPFLFIHLENLPDIDTLVDEFEKLCLFDEITVNCAGSRESSMSKSSIEYANNFFSKLFNKYR